MALGMREIYIILRARDEASRTIAAAGGAMRRFGGDAATAQQRLAGIASATTAVGATFTAAGAAGVHFWGSMTKEAMDFNREAALTLTQTDGIQTNVKELADVARRVGRDIAAPFDEMQEVLYTIFSSMNVDVPQAEQLLRGFAKEAVAGQSEMQAAARTTIAILNAFGLSVEDLGRVQDMQFQTVRKGVITYEELSTTIGRAIPSAVRAGQEIETLGAMIAFLTRNGLSAQMAATSAARALEAFATPKFVDRMRAMGISVTDLEGNFRPLGEVIGELGRRLEDLPQPERTRVLTELLKGVGGGGGGIQARRFFDVAIKNFEDFEQHVEWQINNAGAFADAYEIMAGQPAQRLELLRNRWQALRTELGDALLPAFEGFIKVGERLLGWIERLDPATVGVIARVGAIASALLLIMGSVMMVVGSISGLIAVLMMANLSFAAAAGIILGIPVAIAAVIAAAVALIYYWDEVQSIAATVWTFVRTKVAEAADAIRPLLDNLGASFGDIGNVLGELGRKVRTAISEYFEPFVAMWEGARDVIQSVYQVWSAIFSELGRAIRGAWEGAILPILTRLWDFWSTVFSAIGKVVFQFYHAFWKPILEAVVFVIKNVVWPAIKFFGEIIFTVFRAAWKIVETFWKIVSKLFEIGVALFMHFVMPHIRRFVSWWVERFEEFGQIISWVYDTVVRPVLNRMVAFFENTIQPAIARFAAWWSSKWETIAAVITAVWLGIKSGIASAVNGSLSIIESFINRVINGINKLIDTLNGIPGIDIEKLSNITLPRVSGGATSPGPINVKPGMMLAMKAYHEGGLVEGQRGREVGALLKAGEGVLNEAAMAKIGVHGLNRMNKGETDAFIPTAETGGPLDWGSAALSWGSDRWNDITDFFRRGKDWVIDKAKDLIFDQLGGAIGDNMIGQALLGLTRSAIDQLAEYLGENRFAGGAGMPLGPGIGWQAMWAALSTGLPFARFTSGLRPGARTATGNLSMHALGRAIDVAGQTRMNHQQMLAIAQWIAANYGPMTKELIYSGANAPQLRNGRPHHYTGITRDMHFDHVHWAMSRGGIIPGNRGGVLAEIGEAGKPEAIVPLDRLSELMRAAMQEVIPTPGVPGRGPTALDQYQDIQNAIRAIEANTTAQRELATAHENVKALGEQWENLRSQQRLAHMEMAQAAKMGKVMSLDAEQAWLRAKVNVQDLRNELKAMRSPAGMTASDELGILQQQERIRSLRQNLEALRNPQADADAVAQARQEVQRASAAVQDAQAAYKVVQATVAQRRADVTGARFELARVNQILPAINNEVTALLMRYEAEAGLADSQKALAEAEKVALQEHVSLTDAQQKLKQAQDALTTSRQVAKPTADELRMAELELIIAQEKLAEMQRATTFSTEELRLKEIELELAERALLEAEQNRFDFIPEYYAAQDKLADIAAQLTENERAQTDATRALASAELGAMEATIGLIQATAGLQGVQPAALSFFSSIGNAAGAATNKIREQILAIRELNKINTQTASITQQITSIFTSAGVPLNLHLSGARESAGVRLERLVSEVMSGQTSLAAITASVRRIKEAHGLQHGGIARARVGGVLARIAEGGQDEAVIPLPRGWKQDGLGNKVEITVEAGAVQVNVEGGDVDEIGAAVDEAFQEFLKELRGDWRSR